MSEIQSMVSAEDQLGIETLRTVILGGLDELAGLMPWAERLILARQRGIGFLTVEARAMQDETIRKERAARFPKHHGPVGTKFMRPNTVIAASGDRPYPGDLASSSFRIEAEMVLIEMLRYFDDRLRRGGVCLVPGVPAEPTFANLVTSTRALVGILARLGDLEYVSHLIEQLIGKGRTLVDGDDKKQHPKPCPHCGRMTLVIYISKKVVVCEKDPDTGQFERCICTDAFCLCRKKAIRHEWYANPKTASQRSWWQLADAQKRTERIDNPTEGA